MLLMCQTIGINYPQIFKANSDNKAPGEHGDYDLSSLGKDGQPGGTGDGEDITSW